MSKNKLFKNICAMLLLYAWSTTGFASPTVSGNTITFPSESGWYQVQSFDWSSICEGGPGASCNNVPKGSYYVTNLNNGDRWTVTVADNGGGNGGAGNNEPVVSNSTITFPTTAGWYQVQSFDWSSICEGGPGASCNNVPNGSYYVTNLNNSDRWTVNVTDGGGGGGNNEPVVSNSTITFPSTAGWYQVQKFDWSSVCEGAPGASCNNVANGNYYVTNLNNGDRWTVTVDSGGGGDGGGTCHTETVSSETPLRRIIENCDFPRQDFLLGFAMKDNFGQTWFDRLDFPGCIAVPPESQYRYGPCYNGTVNGNGRAHVHIGKTEFNIMTLEAKQKMSISQANEPSASDIGNSDTNRGFTRGNTENVLNNMGVSTGDYALHGHAIAFESNSVNSTVVPSWFINLTSNSQARIIMKDRVQRELRHYRDINVPFWDVVNEALIASISQISSADVAAFRQSPSNNFDRILKNGWYRQKLGDNWIELLFTWAKEELDRWDPSIPRPELIINDVYVSWENNKSDALYELIAHLNRDPSNKLVDGVGFQAHFYNDFPNNASFNTIKRNMQRFADGLGINLYITEIDVRLRGHDTWEETPISSSENFWQGLRFGTMLSNCLEIPACKAFQVWGMNDRFNWVPQQSVLYRGEAISLGNGEYGFEKKQAYWNLHNTLRNKLN